MRAVKTIYSNFVVRVILFTANNHLIQFHVVDCQNTQAKITRKSFSRVYDFIFNRKVNIYYSVAIVSVLKIKYQIKAYFSLYV